MPLRTLEISDQADARLWTDAWAIDPSTHEVHFLSAVGTPSAVRALKKALPSAVDLTIREGPRSIACHGRNWPAYQWRTGRLPSGAVHLLAVRPVRRPRLVIAPNEETLPQALFNALLDEHALMALPEWAPWLLQTLLNNNHATRLDGPTAAVLVTAEEAILDATIQNGLGVAAIAFPPEPERESA